MGRKYGDLGKPKIELKLFVT